MMILSSAFRIITFVSPVVFILSTTSIERVDARGKRQDAQLDLHTIQVNGEERTYYLYVPRSYKRRPVPLVLHFHGGGSNGAAEAEAGHWPQIAERANFIAAFPNGTKRFGNEGGSWNTGSDNPTGYAERNDVDDVAFVRRLIKDLQESYAIDARRIYATGMSKGAAFAYHAACEMSDVFAAIAPVAGTLTDSDCELSQSVAMLHIHGTDDQNVPLKGGKGRFTAARNEWPPVMQGIEFWRSANKCDARAQQVSKGKDTTCWRYPGCSRGATVGYCLVEGGGHAWPGQKPLRWQKLLGVNVSEAFDATSAIWEFFSQHSK